jgi:hypothetical protein
LPIQRANVCARAAGEGDCVDRASARHESLRVAVLEYPAVACALSSVVKVRMLFVVAPFEPDPDNGYDGESDSKDNNHDHPLVMAIPPGKC